MRKILLINAHSPNKGDLAIINAITDSLLENLTDINIIISTLNYEYAPVLEGVKIIPSVPDMKKSKIRILIAMLALPLTRYSKIFLKLISENERNIIMEYLNSDCVISVGGHHFTDIIGRNIFFIQWYQLFLATFFNKPTVIYSQTIGPFKKSSYILKFLLKILLKKTKLILIRERKSFDFISNDLNINHQNLYLTADTAFLLKPEIDYNNFLISEKIDKNKLTIGITVYHTSYYYAGKEHVLENYKNFMAKICDYLIENYNANIIFIPMEMNYWEDIPLIHNIIDMTKQRDKITVLKNIYNAKETVAIIGNMDLMIAAKTHSLIFSLAQSTPVFCIAYNYKSIEFMKSFGMEKYSFNIDDLNLVIGEKRISELIRDKEKVKKEMQKGSYEIREIAKLNIDLFKNIVFNEL